MVYSSNFFFSVEVVFGFLTRSGFRCLGLQFVVVLRT